MGGQAWIGLGLLAALGAAGVAILGRLGLQELDATLGTALRSLVMSAALVLLVAANGSWRVLLEEGGAIDGRAWLYLVGAGLCGAGSWLAYFGALQLAAAGPVAALDRLSLPLVFVLGALLLGETAGWRGWLGVVLAVGGAYLIVWDQLRQAAV
jgi:transporter family protein